MFGLSISTQHFAYQIMNTLRRIFLVITVSLYLVGCGGVIPIGQPRPAYGTANGGLIGMLFANIPELRSPKFSEFARRTNSTAPISIAAAYVVVPYGGRYLCDRHIDPSCLAVAIGDEINQYPQVLEKIKTLASNPCAYLPETPAVPTDVHAGVRLEKRIDRRDLIETKEYFGCDGMPKSRRNIHFLIVKDSDETLHPYNISERLEKNVTRKFVVTVN